MKVLSLSLTVFICGFIHAQHTNILISRVSNPNEISIALNESNPLEMIAGANIASIYTSVNGGVTWNRMEQKSTFGVWGDPVVGIDSNGNYFHFHLSRPKDGNYIDRIVCQKSTDKGLTFDNGSYAGLNGTKAQDKHWIDFDFNLNTIYVSWTQFDEYDSTNPKDRSNILFSKSKDNGESWSEPIKINSVSGDCLDNDGTVEGAVPAVGADGNVNIAWAGPNGLVFNRSIDGGDTWLAKEKKIADFPGGWAINVPGIYRANGLPITKCDRTSGNYNGTIYVNWADQRNGENDTDIWLSKSTDNGTNWSEPIRVNQDKTKSHQFFTWMDIDQTNGNLYFVYCDRRNYKCDSTDIYLSFSTNGGETFTDTKISETPFIPDSTVFFGDYNNVVAHGGVVRPAWTRLDGKNLSVWTAIIDSDYLHDPQTDNFVLNFTGGVFAIKNKEKIKGSILVEAMNSSWSKLWHFKSRKGSATLKISEELETGIYSVTVKDKKKTYKRNFVVKD